jgi:hypothetical protein
MKNQPLELKPLHVALGATAACTLDFLTRSPAPAAPPEVVHAWVQIGLLILSIALSYLAGKLLAKRVKPKFDDRVTTLATRGSYVPRVIGRREVGCIFAWAGQRYTRKERMDGGKGSTFSGPKSTVYVEHGWHLLAMGPVRKLHRITQNGEVLFAGPITSTSHPSGSTIDLGKEGSFRIFWGEFDQPINTFLSDANRVTVASRWPGMCYIEWRNKRLGTAAIWPTLNYEIECRTQSTILSNTPAYMEPTRTLDGNVNSMLEVTAGTPGNGKFIFTNNVTSRFYPGQLVRLTGHTGMADQDLTIRKMDVRVVATLIGLDINGDPIYDYDTFTDIFFDETISGGTDDGQIQGYTEAQDDGINYAHVLAELLFEGDGYGLNHDQDLYDMDSLEDLGTLCVTENLRANVIGQDGVTYQELIGGILIDIGVFLSTDYTTGKLKFVPIREPSGTLPVVSSALQTSLPEIAVQHADRPVTNVLYSFKDRAHNYEDTTIGADDDGQVQETNVAKAEVNQIISTTNFVTASVCTERRQQEALAGGAQVVIPANRSAREIIPGTAFLADGFDEVLRLLTVEADPLSGNVKLQVVTDFYGAPLSTFLQNGGKPLVSYGPTSPDPLVGIVEVPEYLLQGTQTQTLLVPRVRFDAGVQGADLHLSRDDVTYSLAGRDLTLMTGGTLIDPLTSYDFQRPATTPTFTAVGPDINDVLDLSADLTSWCNGRQLCILVNPTSLAYEICFLKKVSSLGGGIYSLDGLIRARYDTPQQDFSAGALVFILQNDDGLAIQDVLLEPQVQVFVKTQPFGSGGQLPLDEAVPTQMALYGKGVRPLTPKNIRIDTGLTTWTDSADFDVRWDYFTPRTVGSGAGFQAAGAAASSVLPEGEFIVEILNASNTVIRQFSQAAASYTYTAAQRTTDFGADPASLKFRITQLRGGYSSDTNTQTFTKVT